MGLFFEDTKPPAPVVQIVKQDWLAVLIGGAWAVVTTLLIGLLTMLGWVAKPYIAWCTNIEGKSRKEALGRISCLVMPILVAIFLIFQMFPGAWDFVSLSKTRTINHSQDGYRILFPDNSYFVVKEQRYRVHNDNDGSCVYIAYAGYTKDSMQKMEPGQCQLVPRSKKMGFSSLRPPLRAEGFKDEVTYTISLKVPNLSMWRYVLYRLGNWKDLFKGRDYFAYSTVEYEHTSSWNEFVDNWDKVWSPPNMSGYRPFEARALWNEHAIARF